MKQAIKVLVVDDSAFMRYTLAKHLSRDPDIVVVGSARDGGEALNKIPALAPDVITLDVEMPVMDGIATLEQIMASFPRPVIMVSSLTERGARTTIRALMRGAVDFIAKPASASETAHTMAELVKKIKAACQAGEAGIASRLVSTSPLVVKPPAKRPPGRFQPRDPLAVIGASTGGPRALQDLLSRLPADTEAAFLVVQHMPGGFTQTLAERLNETCALTVREAVQGDTLARGLVLFAPGDYHLTLDEGDHIRLNQEERVNHVRPAVDVTLRSVAARHGPNTICIILTGMGSDGTAGARLVHAGGGLVIAEDAATAVVYGMPRSVVEAGVANKVLPLHEIASFVVQAVADQRRRNTAPPATLKHTA